MTGHWSGVGVGPGDPELMTIKAARRLLECDVIAIPHENREQCTAYQIAVLAVPEIEKKPCLCLPMPMTKDPQVLERSHQEAAERTADCLRQGENVAFLTLGDATIYSTCLYVMERLRADGFSVELLNGIPSFCAAAARLGIGLVNGTEELHVIPASYQIEEALSLPGVKVFMKAGRRLAHLRERLIACGAQVWMVENCGMEGERVMTGAEAIPEDAGYFSLLLVR